MIRTLLHSAKHNLMFMLGMAFTALTATFALFVLVPQTSGLAFCNSNSIMYCGATSKTDFINKTKSGDGLGHKDLAAIYGKFGFISGDYTRFINTAKVATIYKNGNVVVDGKTVATDAVSYGRSKSLHDGPGMKTMSVGGTTIYGNSTTQTMDRTSLSGWVLFDNTGTPEFIVMGPCGNPVTAKIVKSSAVCDSLSVTTVAGKLNTYDFTARASKTGLATITKYVYDFGDGSGTVTKTSGSDAVTHEYKKDGTFTAKVTIYASAPGGATIASSTTACKKQITVNLPYYLCSQLGGELLDKDTYSYRFVATAKYGNGATFVSADFDFGDGNTATGVTSTDGTNVIAEHSYAKPGSYSASAILRFSVNGKTVTAPTCRASVTPTKPPVPECKPGVPVGDIRCNPCPYDSSISAEDEKCEAPVTELPNTGAGNVIALSSLALIGGFLAYRHRLFLRHKQAYEAAERGTSPLPLADAMNAKQPLAGTPLDKQEASRSTFRRRRQF